MAESDQLKMNEGEIHYPWCGKDNVYLKNYYTDSTGDIVIIDSWGLAEVVAEVDTDKKVVIEWNEKEYIWKLRN